MHNKLLEIIEKKKEDLILQMQNVSLHELKEKCESSHAAEYENKFRKNIIDVKDIALIAEIKFASPTNPSLGSQEELLERAKAYEESGADAISIITEPHFFKGEIAFIKKVKQHVTLPVLQKDFVIDVYQIYEAKSIGSDALLLIARLLDAEALKSFVRICNELQIEPVVEINNEEDLKKAVETEANIIAVNARDLETFEIDVTSACELMKKIPDNFIKLGFSGINFSDEVVQYKNAGAAGVLVGTSLMKAKNVSGFIDSLRVLPEVKVKICATRSLEAAEQAYKNGADFLGLVFTPSTRNHTVDLKVAREIGEKMKGKIQLVGVFQNMPLEIVQKIIKECNLDYAQFHGDETPEYLSKIKIKTMKAFRFAGDFDVTDARSQMQQFNVGMYLVDRIKQSEGPMLNLGKVAILAKEFPLAFAGGLNPENVSEVIKKVKPQMVDVASGVETDGQQDLKKIQLFIQNAKEATV